MRIDGSGSKDENVLEIDFLCIIVTKKHKINKERIWHKDVWYIDRVFKITYTKLSDRSVETCEAYRRGRALRVSPSFGDMTICLNA